MTTSQSLLEAAEYLIEYADVESDGTAKISLEAYLGLVVATNRLRNDINLLETMNDVPGEG